MFRLVTLAPWATDFIGGGDHKEGELRRLSAQAKIKLLKVAEARLRARSHRPSNSDNVGRTAKAKADFAHVRRQLPVSANDLERYPGFFAFTPPAHLSLSENYKPTLAFLMDFKRLFVEKGRHLCDDGLRRPAYADFAAIEHIGPGAGLVLAAEVHKYAQARARLTEVHDHLWAENVRTYFLETGLFDLLRIDPNEVTTKPSKGDPRTTLKYAMGRTTHGRDAKLLIGRLQELSGHSVGPRPAVYAAIAEALANVSHAYPNWYKSWPYRASKQWWASGFWDATRNAVGLQLYDQGASIPATLPKQTYWPRLLKGLDREATPSGLIAAAMEYGRTSTGQQGRGKGLAEMANWIEMTGSGFLRILSGGGEVTYRPGRKITRLNHDAPFFGTLVQWEVSVGN